MNGFRIYGIRFGVMVCIDLNGWLVQNKLSLQDEAPEQFSVLADGYTKSKEEQLNRIAEASKKLKELNSKTIDVERFISVVNKYTDISELNQEIVNAFIERIVIHERSEPHKRKGYTQKVDIYFNFIGKLGDG